MLNPINFQPAPPKVTITKPMVMNKLGNLYKTEIKHVDNNNKPYNYQVWMTKGAVKSHFPGLEDNQITRYHLQAFAKNSHEKFMRATGGRAPEKQGIFISSTQQIHGNPKVWPTVLTDPELREPGK